VTSQTRRKTASDRSEMLHPNYRRIRNYTDEITRGTDTDDTNSGDITYSNTVDNDDHMSFGGSHEEISITYDVSSNKYQESFCPQFSFNDHEDEERNQCFCAGVLIVLRRLFGPKQENSSPVLVPENFDDSSQLSIMLEEESISKVDGKTKSPNIHNKKHQRKKSKTSKKKRKNFGSYLKKRKRVWNYVILCSSTSTILQEFPREDDDDGMERRNSFSTCIINQNSTGCVPPSIGNPSNVVEINLKIDFFHVRYALLCSKSVFLSQTLFTDGLGYKDINLQPWNEHDDKIGEYDSSKSSEDESFIGATRFCSYLMPKSTFVGANRAYETMTLINYDGDQSFAYRKETRNPDVPYGKSFVTVTQFIVFHSGNGNSRMICSVEPMFEIGGVCERIQVSSGRQENSKLKNANFKDKKNLPSRLVRNRIGAAIVSGAIGFFHKKADLLQVKGQSYSYDA